jgi:hypothetical protein
MSLIPKKLDDAAAARDDIVSSPEITAGEAERASSTAVKTALAPTVEVNPEDEEKDLSHGRTVTKLLGLSFKEATGERMDSDYLSAFEDVFACIFSGLRTMFMARWPAVLLLGMAALPAFGLVVWRMWQGMNDTTEKEDSKK